MDKRIFQGENVRSQSRRNIEFVFIIPLREPMIPAASQNRQHAVDGERGDNEVLRRLDVGEGRANLEEKIFLGRIVSADEMLKAFLCNRLRKIRRISDSFL